MTMPAAAAVKRELSSVELEFDGDVAVETKTVVLSCVTRSLPGSWLSDPAALVIGRAPMTPTANAQPAAFFGRGFTS